MQKVLCGGSEAVLVTVLGNRQVAHRATPMMSSEQLAAVPLVGISRDIDKYIQFSVDFERVCAGMDWALSL